MTSSRVRLRVSIEEVNEDLTRVGRVLGSAFAV